jgi:ABC-2 type transport system permease protein
MIAIFKRELSSFFATPVGYLFLLVFWIVSGLFLWVFKSDFNILDYGFADLSPYFFLAPWIFMFLIPALSMKTIAEERKVGTLELLFTYPVSLFQIVMGKFLGIVFLGIMALLPSILYVISIIGLASDTGRPDMGLIFGSYLGLALLLLVYTGIGIFSSSLTDNQIVAFLTAVVLSFFLFSGFEGFASILNSGRYALNITEMGMKAHFENMGQGILDSRDLIYFLSLIVFFLFAAATRLKRLRA